MTDFYAQFVRAGELTFDVGAHRGSRTAAFRQLGARVVAIEPVKESVRELFVRFHGDPEVTIVPRALGGAEGQAEMHISRPFRFSSTLNPDYARAGLASGRYEPRVTAWDETATVAVTTLDALIATFGTPVFIKIDVEGGEAEVLRGLSRPVPSLSFEFHPHFLEPARQSIAWLQGLGQWRMNAVIEERFAWHLPEWITPAEMLGVLDAFAPAASFLYGDVYARLVTPA